MEGEILLAQGCCSDRLKMFVAVASAHFIGFKAHQLIEMEGHQRFGVSARCHQGEEEGKR
jgi:hypothetical protein